MSASPDISLRTSDESEGDEDGDILSSSGEITTDSETVDEQESQSHLAVWRIWEEWNGILILENVICWECKLKLNYKTSPSSFLQHLSNKHLVLNQTKEPGAKIKDFFQPAVKKTGIKYPEKHPTQRKFWENLTRWIVRKKHPFVLVEDAELRTMIDWIDPKLKVPSNNTVKNDILKKYISFRR